MSNTVFQLGSTCLFLVPVALLGCSHQPNPAEDGQQMILVDAMPVSAEVGPDVGGAAGEQVRVVTVRLADSAGNEAAFVPGQEFLVKYQVVDAEGRPVGNEELVIDRQSPRRHTPSGAPSSRFEFRIYARKGGGPEYRVRLYVSYLAHGVWSNPFPAWP